MEKVTEIVTIPKQSGENGANGPDRSKNGVFFDDTDKIHKNGRSTLCDFALETGGYIGYNMVTKVTTHYFCMSQMVTDTFKE